MTKTLAWNISLVLIAAVLFPLGARAANYTWDASGGDSLDDGSGSWNAAGGFNWRTDGGVYGAWGNLTTDSAVIGVSNGAAGTISVGTVNCGNITFNAAGSGNYLLTNGTITLGTSILSINVDATIASTLAANANALTKTGSGTLKLTAATARTGATTISGGTLRLEKNAAGNNLLGSGGLTINNGATLSMALTGNSTEAGSLAVPAAANATIVLDNYTVGGGGFRYTLGGTGPSGNGMTLNVSKGPNAGASAVMTLFTQGFGAPSSINYNIGTNTVYQIGSGGYGINYPGGGSSTFNKTGTGTLNISEGASGVPSSVAWNVNQGVLNAGFRNCFAGTGTGENTITINVNPPGTGLGNAELRASSGNNAIGYNVFDSYQHTSPELNQKINLYTGGTLRLYYSSSYGTGGNLYYLGGTVALDRTGVSGAGVKDTMANLVIGSMTLAPTAENGFTSAPTLAFRLGTTLTGNPTFDTSQVSITPGALVDGGVTRTITIIGSGTSSALQLTSATGPSQAFTKYVVNSGATLDIANGSAMGTTPVIWADGTLAHHTVSSVTFPQILNTNGLAGSTASITYPTSGTVIIGDSQNLDTALNGAVAPTGSAGSNFLTKRGTGKLTLGGTDSNTMLSMITVNAGELDLNKTGGAVVLDTVNGASLDIYTGSTVKCLQNNQFGDETTTAFFDLQGGTFDLDGHDQKVSYASATGGAIIGPGALTGYGGNFSFLAPTVVSAVLAGDVGVDVAADTTLSGTNTYTGATTVNAGLLRVNGSTHALSAVGVGSGSGPAFVAGTGTVNGPITINDSADSGVNLMDGAVGTLNGESLTFNGAASSGNNVLLFDLGDAGTNDKLVLTGSHSATNADSVLVYLCQLPGTSIGSGTYTLIQGGAASLFTGYKLGLVTGTGRTVYSALGASGHNLVFTVAAGIPGDSVGNVYWKGDTAIWNTAAWYSDAAGTVAANRPGYSSNVRFAATGAGNLTNALGEDYEINSLTVNAGLAALSINAGNTLTIDASGDNSNPVGNGITVSNAAGTTIAAGVILASNQTWTVGAGAALTVSGSLGDFHQGHSLTKAGGGDVVLSGANTFSGGLTIKAGTVYGAHPTAFGSGAITMGDSTGSSDVTLAFDFNDANTYLIGPLSVASGNTGKATILWSSGGGAISVDNGPITLNRHDLFFGNGVYSDDAYTFSGGITGTGNVVVALNGGSNPNMTLLGALNMTGTLSNQCTQSGADAVLTVSGGIGANVQRVIQDSSGVSMRLSGSSPNYAGGVWVRKGRLMATGATNVLGTAPLILGDATVATSNAVSFSGNATITNNIALADRGAFTGTITMGSDNNSGLTYNGTITGSNDLILANLTGSSGGTTFGASSSINNRGAVTNTNAGSGAVTINGSIGANVTAFTQNSGASKMTLSADNPFAGTMTALDGTLELNHTNALKNATLDTGPSGTQQVTFVVSGTKTYALGGLAGANVLSNGANSVTIKNQLAPGHLSVGTLTVSGSGTVALASGVVVEIGRGEKALDRLEVPNGTLVLPAAATLNVSGGGRPPASLVILSAATLTGDVTGWSVTAGYKIMKVGNTVVFTQMVTGSLISVF